MYRKYPISAERGREMCLEVVGDILEMPKEYKRPSQLSLKVVKTL
jgi:hypothetical protein